jgi:hypothetical protein
VNALAVGGVQGSSSPAVIFISGRPPVDRHFMDNNTVDAVGMKRAANRERLRLLAGETPEGEAPAKTQTWQRMDGAWQVESVHRFDMFLMGGEDCKNNPRFRMALETGCRARTKAIPRGGTSVRPRLGNAFAWSGFPQ